jgi:hypothetical protein
MPWDSPHSARPPRSPRPNWPAPGISQAAVAKTEQREDLLLSTLNAYIEALGGQAHIVITFNGEEIELGLGALRRDAAPA